MDSTSLSLMSISSWWLKVMNTSLGRCWQLPISSIYLKQGSYWSRPWRSWAAGRCTGPGNCPAAPGWWSTAWGPGCQWGRWTSGRPRGRRLPCQPGRLRVERRGHGERSIRFLPGQRPRRPRARASPTSPRHSAGCPEGHACGYVHNVMLTKKFGQPYIFLNLPISYMGKFRFRFV